LVVIKECLILIVHGSFNYLASTRGTSTSTAGIGEVNACLFCCVKDISILSTLDSGLGAVGRAESNIVSHILVSI
jgi:hypothetical protein